MKERLFTILLLLISCHLALTAQGMIIETWSGEQKVELLEPIAKIGFPGAYLLVEKNNASSNSYNLYNVRKIYFDPTVGMQTLGSDKNNIGIYPNPATEAISLCGITGELTVHIYSLHGKRLISRTFFNQDESIDITSLEPGLYIALINEYAIKFVKK